MSEHIEPKPKTVKIPGPDHPISVERNANRVVVTAAGRIVADTQKALTLREASYPPVQYIPRKDVDMTMLARTDHATYCPYKGDWAYYSIPLGGVRSTNAVWRPSGTISPSIQTASTQSRRGQAAHRTAQKTTPLSCSHSSPAHKRERADRREFDRCRNRSAQR
jgi:uncharacterized protein (DUF427 family)